MKILVCFSLLIINLYIAAQEADSIIDSRDGNVYNIVEIGQQWWFQENLDFGTRIDGSQEASDNGIPEKYYVNDRESLGEVYGGLYQWDEVTGYDQPEYENSDIVRGFCPVGWHIANQADWVELVNFLGGESVAGGKMKETGTTHWLDPNEGATNESNFTALPGGYRGYEGGVYYQLFGTDAFFWMSTGSSADFKNSVRLFNYTEDTTESSASADFTANMNFHGLSVRCIKDNDQMTFITVTDSLMDDVSELVISEANSVVEVYLFSSYAAGSLLLSLENSHPDVFSVVPGELTLAPGDSAKITISYEPGGYGVFLDTVRIESNDPYTPVKYIYLNASKPESDSIIDIRDGRIYDIVKIGANWWMKENLNAGTRVDINQGVSDDGIVHKYCFNDDPANCLVYGGLYAWDEMMAYNPTDEGDQGTTRGICPVGWHLPTEQEWTTFFNDLGGIALAGGKLKEADTEHWAYPNEGATNETGFTALPGSYTGADGLWDSIGYAAYFWSATVKDNRPERSWGWIIRDYSEEVFKGNMDRNLGLSVRCLVDTSRMTFLNITDVHMDTEPALNFSESNRSITLVIINSNAGRTVALDSIYTATATYRLNVSSAELAPGDSIHLLLNFDLCEKDNGFTDTLVIESDDPVSPELKIPLSGTVNEFIEEICIVTIDQSSGKYLIVWEKTEGKGIDFYNVYREGNLIGSTSISDWSYFVDTTARPENRPYLYQLAFVDTCGNESELSTTHKPHFLQYTPAVDVVNLIWDEYEIDSEPLSFDSYTLYRGSELSDLTTLEANIPYAINVYTDNDPVAVESGYYYRVAGILDSPCNPTGDSKKSIDADYSVAMSNYLHNIYSVVDERVSDNDLAVYPNPSSGLVTIESGGAFIGSVEILDITGKQVLRKQFDNRSKEVTLDLDLPAGTYLLKVVSGANCYNSVLIMN